MGRQGLSGAAHEQCLRWPSAPPVACLSTQHLNVKVRSLSVAAQDSKREEASVLINAEACKSQSITSSASCGSKQSQDLPLGGRSCLYIQEEQNCLGPSVEISYQTLFMDGET